MEDVKRVEALEEKIAKLEKRLSQAEGKDGKKKGVYIPPQQKAPYRPEYAHMSKQAVIEAERKRREGNLKLEEMRVQLEQEAKIKPEAETPKPETAKPEPETPKGKPRGRPKKIE